MKPPFRADQVGSLLRPVWLAEDRAIRETVQRQQDIGLQASPTASSGVMGGTSISWPSSTA